MHRLLAIICAALVVCSATLAVGMTTPEIDQPVVDQADVLSSTDETEIGQRLRDHYEQTGVQMAVLLVETTGDEPIEDYSLRVAQEWGGGRAGEDRGVLLTLAIDDRRSRLEVGYGLEVAVPDSAAARILENMRPDLRDEDYRAAVELAVGRILAFTEHIEAGEPASASPRLWWSLPARPFWLCVLIGLLGVGVPVWFRRRGHERLKQVSGKRLFFAGSLAAICVAIVLSLVFALLGVSHPALGMAVAALWGGALALPFFEDDRAIWGAVLLYVVGGVVCGVLDVFMGGVVLGLTLSAALYTAIAHGIALLGGAVFLMMLLSMVGFGGGGQASSYSSTGERRDGYSSSGSSGYSGSSGGYSGGGGSFGGGGASGGW